MNRCLRLLGLLQTVSGALFAGSMEGQGAATRVEENLRAAPNGAILGVVRPAAPLLVHERQDTWLAVELEGWMWRPSVQERSQGAFDLVVSEAAGENLRTAPSGAIVARLWRGTLLEELERNSSWVRVRRSGWMWAESVMQAQNGAGRGGAARTGTATVATAGATRPPGSTAPPPSANSPSAPARAPSAPATPPPSTGTVERPATATENSVLVLDDRGTALLDAPQGDTLARGLANASVQVTARDGGWARVRVEGWVWAPASDSARPAVEEGIRPSDVVAEPARFTGRVVRWDLQFISLERAERIRTDFVEGEPFLLTRPLAGDRFFIYVAVPPDRLAEVSGLLPLEQIRVVARVRTGASTLTGSPVLELIELQGRAKPRG